MQLIKFEYIRVKPDAYTKMDSLTVKKTDNKTVNESILHVGVWFNLYVFKLNKLHFAYIAKMYQKNYECVNYASDKRFADSILNPDLVASSPPTFWPWGDRPHGVGGAYDVVVLVVVVVVAGGRKITDQNVIQTTNR